jgi:hypothetical protein
MAVTCAAQTYTKIPYTRPSNLIFHITLNVGYSRSTKMFHEERFSPEIHFLPTFHGFSPGVNKNIGPTPQKKPSQSDGVVNSWMVFT